MDFRPVTSVRPPDSSLLWPGFFTTDPALVFAVFWIPLMMLSRLYLGRRFLLADMAGGLAVGGVCFVATGIMLGPHVRPSSPPVACASHRWPWSARLSRCSLRSVVPWTPEDVGRLAGLLVGLWRGAGDRVARRTRVRWLNVVAGS